MVATMNRICATLRARRCCGVAGQVDRADPALLVVLQPLRLAGAVIRRTASWSTGARRGARAEEAQSNCGVRAACVCAILE